MLGDYYFCSLPIIYNLSLIHYLSFYLGLYPFLDLIDLGVLRCWEISVCLAQSGCHWPVHKSLQGFVLQINLCAMRSSNSEVNQKREHSITQDLTAI